MAIGPAIAKPSGNKCRSFCKLISNSMHVSLAQTNTTIIDHALKSLLRTGGTTIGRYREDCPSSERPRISIAHPGCAWAACGPTKRPTFSWWNVQMHSIWRQCCILTKFRFVIKSTWFFFFKHWYVFLPRKHIMQWINAPASRERKLHFQYLSYVSSITCWIKTVGLISIRFTGIDQLHIPGTSTELYANWMSASSWFLCLKAAITFACIDLPISVHNVRHLSANGFVIVRPVAAKFVRD